MWEKHRGVWQVIDLGHIRSNSTWAGWINDHGDVAGDWFDDTVRGFFYSDGAFVDLGSPDGHHLNTYAINNSGWVVGNLSDFGGFLWIDGEMHMLSGLVLPPPRDRISAYGMNDADVIVGARGCCGGPQDAIVLIPNNIGDLDGDGDVDGADLILLLGAWGACDDRADCPADLDLDGAVGPSDLIILLGNWG